MYINFTPGFVLGSQITSDGWLKSPFSSYEYAVIFSDNMDFNSARQKCQSFGGELAYASLFNEQKSFE